jgi:PAS domain S-box-containing protein
VLIRLKWPKIKGETSRFPAFWARLQGWQLFSLFGLIAMGGYFLIPRTSPGILNIYFATYNLLPVGAIIAARKKLPGKQRFAWYLIAIGLSWWAAGEYLWAFNNFISGQSQIPYPSISDILFELYYPFIFAGVLLLARGRSRLWNIGTLVDAALVTCSAGVLTWNFFITPQLQGSSLDLVQILVTVSLPIFDLLLLSIGVFYLLLPGKRTPSYYFLALSLSIILISDMFYGFALLSGTYYSGHPLTAGWMLGFICWGVAVLHPSRASLAELNSPEQARTGRLQFIMLGGASIFGPGMFIAQEVLRIPLNVPLLVISSLLLFLFVVLRLGLMVRRSEALATELAIQARRQAELARFSQTALSITSLNALFDEIVKLISRALDVDFGVILELGSEGNRPVFRWGTKSVISNQLGIPIPIGQGLLSGHVVAAKKPITVSNWYSQTKFKPTEFVIANDIKSTLAVPIFERESSIYGVLLAHSTFPSHFTANEETFLQSVASIAAAVIERKRMEDALQQERDFGLQVMNNMGQGLIVEDGSRNVLFVNPVMARMLGYETGELLGHSIDVFLSATAKEQMPDIMAQHHQGITNTVEVSLVQKDGRSFYASVTGVPILKEGILDRVILVINDITERKKADEEMQKALVKEKELGELKSRFVSATSHEFRTPLTSIMSSAELLEHYGHRYGDEKKQEILRRIQTSVKYMSNMLDDILVFGRADAGKLQFNPVPLDLVAESREALEEIKFQLNGQHQAEFTVKGLPVETMVDPNSLKRILLNLLSNAIKYSPRGGLIGLDLTYSPEGRVEIRVSDQGIGILPEDQGHVFEVFHRGRNVGLLAGTGLGLSIVKQSVDQHNGAIEVCSTPNRGTTFKVTLPLVPVPAKKDELVSQAAAL